MDFSVGEDQRELAEGIRSVVAGRLPLEQIRAHEGAGATVDPDDWAALGETGVFALTVAEPAGTGLGLADAAVVFEELGRALVPGPLVGTFLAAAHGLVDGATEGQAVVGVHHFRPGVRSEPVLVEHLGSLDALVTLRGPWSQPAAHLLTPAPDAPAGARMAMPLDPLTPLWRLDTVEGGDPLPAPVAAALVRDGALLTAALQVGHAVECLDLAVDYAKGRNQFGKPIGSFQAIKHLCADMLVRAEVARAAVHAAACLVDAPDVAASEAEVAGCSATKLVERAVQGAKMLADEAALANARASIQVHGGMGFTWEVPLHLHLKRSRLLCTTFGTPSEQALAVAAIP
jgi:alkylation response protein AidB-like acyl-CoA dehydrogenase